MTTTHAQETSQSKSFGERQVEQMLDDRPDMRNVIKRDDFIYKWVVSGFEGGGVKDRIHWNATKPMGKFRASHAPSYSFYPPQIYISDSPAMSGLEKWFSAVFELFNLDNEMELRKLCAQALDKEISFDQFADACVELERNAEKITVRFLESKLPDKHPLLTCEGILSSEFSQNKKRNGRWDYGPNRAHFMDYIKVLDVGYR